MAKKTNINYEQSLSEIKEIIAQLEQNNLNLDEMTEKIERAALLIKNCKQKLQQTDSSIQDILDHLND